MQLGLWSMLLKRAACIFFDESQWVVPSCWAIVDYQRDWARCSHYAAEAVGLAMGTPLVQACNQRPTILSYIHSRLPSGIQCMPTALLVLLAYGMPQLSLSDSGCRGRRLQSGNLAQARITRVDVTSERDVTWTLVTLCTWLTLDRRAC